VKNWMLFDFDGTIANSIDQLYKLVNGLAPRYGYTPITPEKFAAMRDFPLSRACKALKVPLYKLGQAITVILSEYLKIVPDLEPCAGVVPMLQELKAMEISLALISSNHSENVRAFLDHHRIDCFDWVEGTGGILHKHDSIRRQIRKHGLDKEKVVYVGDESRDIKAARKSRVQVISVTWGLHSEAHLRGFKPDWLVSDPAEIVAIAKQLFRIAEPSGPLE